MPINFGASVRRLLRNAGTGSDKLDALPTDESYLNSFKSGSAEPFFKDFTEETLIRDAIDDINEVLGLLIPAQPPLFPNGQSLNLSTQNNRNLAQGAPSNGNSATAGNLYDTVYTNTVSQSGQITEVGPGDQGTLTLERNGNTVEVFTLTGDANNSSIPSANANDRFEIFDNQAYPSEDQPFWQEFSIRNIRADIFQGLNNIKMKHDPTDSPETSVSANVVYDDLTPANPSVNIENLTTSATPTVYGGIPHLKSGDTVNISISGSGTSGITYRNSNFCQIAGNNVQSAPDRTYQALNGGSIPVTGSDLGIVSNSFTVGTNPGEVTPTVTLRNSRGNATDTWSGNKIVSVGNTSNTSVRENNIISDKIFLYANRSEPTTNRTDVSSSYDPQSNYPTGSTPESFVGLDPVTELTGPVYDEVAVNVAGEVIPDKENYSSGYLVPGPDYGGKPSVQYFSVSFETLRHTNVSMRYKGKISQLNIGVEYRGTSAWLDTNPYSDNAGSVSSYAPGDSGINTFPTQDNNGNTYYQFTLENANLPGFVPTSPNMKVVYVFKLNAGVSDKLEELSFSRFNDAISGV